GVLGLMGAQSFAYATENAGHVMRDVVARTDARHERSSQGWGEELPWHMDGAFRPMVESATSALSPAPRWLVFGVIYDTPRVPLTFISVDGVLKQLRRRDVLTL